MRNPNGYGTVVKLSGKRRKQYGCRVTDGWSDEGKQLFRYIGYYEEKKDAIKALARYNENPYDMDAQKMTFSDVYDAWSEEKFKTVGDSSITAYTACYKYSEALHDTIFMDIKSKHMQDVITNSKKNYSMRKKIKGLFNQMYRYAMENDIVFKDYSKYVDIGKKESKSSRTPFTKAEIKRLFEVVDKVEYVDTVLMMIYSGFRIGELLEIEVENINLENMTMIGGLKTEAGIDRIVPINSKILPFIESRMADGGKYLIVNHKGKQMKYSNYYREKWQPVMEQLNMDHTPHDCRHTFATLMANAGADKIALQKIIGHASYVTTANIYTHKDVAQLQNAINLI